MRLWEWLLLAVVALWVPLSLALYFFVRSRQRLEYRGFKPEYADSEQLRALLEETRSRATSTETEVERLREFLVTASRETASQDDLRTQLAMLDKRIAALTTAGTASELAAVEPVSMPSEYRVVRELAHSLKTPLAGIESTLLRHRPDGPNPDVGEEWQDLMTSLEICKAVVAAFREVTRVSSEAPAWEPKSIRSMLESAHVVYDKALGRRTGLVANLPDSLPGYSANFVVASLLPLLENAVEASPTDADINVSFLTQDDRVLLRVENMIASDHAKAANDAETSSHDGLGLQTVGRLVEAGAEGRFSHVLDDDSFTAIIELPQKRTTT
jgi:K+-sensing histidine kinase KdpD